MSKPARPQINKQHEVLHHAIANFAHVLPAQASIKDFVHHNTLHGFEHLKFPEAMKASHELTGAYGYWPQERFRVCYLKGRITDDDIHNALATNKPLDPKQLVYKSKNNNIQQQDIYRIAALFPLKKISKCQLVWQSEEAHAFDQFQDDVPQVSREALLASAGVTEPKAIQALWEACVDSLGLDSGLLHPEEMVNLAPEQAEKIFSKVASHDDLVPPIDESLSEAEKKQQREQQEAWKKLQTLTQSNHLIELAASAETNQSFNLRRLIKALTGFNVTPEITAPSQSKIDPLIQKQAWKNLDELINKIGNEITLRGFLQKLTGEDIQADIVPYLLPYISNWLDEGFARWHANPESKLSFYQTWKCSAALDESPVFHEISDWKEHINSLPESAIDTVVTELGRMGIPEDKWGAYITRLALDLPGWSGMFYWRHEKSDYDIATKVKVHVDMMDYLAVRLVLEHLHLRKVCRHLWLIEGDLDTIRGYLHQQDAEFLVRHALFNEHLPEYVKASAQRLVRLTAQRENINTHQNEWHELAQVIWTWQQSLTVSSLGKPLDESLEKPETKHDAWVLFRLAQHLGLSDKDIKQLDQTQLASLFVCIERMDEETAGFALLQAYENNYRNQVFATVTKNHGRGTWASREKRPQAQLIFCMDDREEGIRRHIEHKNPAIETFGAAAFFGIVMNWKGVDASASFPLCPVVATPAHEIEEVADSQHTEEVIQHQKNTALRIKVRNFIHQDSHRSVIRTALLTTLYMPVAFVTLVGKIFTPLKWSKSVLSLQKGFDKEAVTRVETTFSATKNKQSTLKHGFTIEEQTNIVEGFLQNNGLLSGFSPFVVLIGHYSRNQNNPHTSAYGCGACSGKFSGPNGRVFATMANNSEVRTALAKRDIFIPDDCWFVGAEHDTCNEAVKWEDTDLVPENLQADFKKLQEEVYQASQQSAHERCRKLASAPKKPTLKSAKNHIAGRAVDFSQARPELGHATIATGFVGRRHLSQGMFMDRRCFLISYDANVDPEGDFLERILLSAGPVGAGISLEYYFSAVNNEKYGCGSKIVHNLTGLFGVMEGASGDLRTGLPLQMIEIHEPMRLQLMVEAKTETLTKIYQNQPSIQELVGNGWILLSAKDPDSEKIHTFNPEKGWELWEDGLASMPSGGNNNEQNENKVVTINKSQDWYSESYDHLPAALIETVNTRTR